MTDFAGADMTRAYFAGCRPVTPAPFALPPYLPMFGPWSPDRPAVEIVAEHAGVGA